MGIQINEPHVPPKNIVISKIYLELERTKNKREDIAKELEKFENEVEVAKTRRKIHLLKSNPSLTTWKNQTSRDIPSIPTCGHVINR